MILPALTPAGARPAETPQRFLRRAYLSCNSRRIAANRHNLLRALARSNAKR